MSYQSYTELEVWKKSRILVNDIYCLTKKFPKDEIYGLSSQMRRCVISIPSNIAEGCGRQHPRDAIQFFYIARGSLYELAPRFLNNPLRKRGTAVLRSLQCYLENAALETQIYLAFDQKYFMAQELKQILEMIQECRKLIHGFIKYYRNLKTTPGNSQLITENG